MGNLRSRRIVQSRIWLDDSYTSPLPSYDYDFSYPITVYDAVRRTTDDNATTLTDEIAAIYRLIAEKQPLIPGGNPGQLMSWSGVEGTIGTKEIVTILSTNSAEASPNKIPTERAVLLGLEKKTPLLDFNLHRDDTSIHVSDIEKTRWNSMAPLTILSAHAGNNNMHTTVAEKTRWNAKADAEVVDNHIYDYNNPHRVTAHQVNSYTRAEIDELIQGIHESFFNYLNIEYNAQRDEAELVSYDSTNWNPNFVLSYDDSLPDITDVTFTYFALKPATDYESNETDQCIIYIKTPGVAWREIGTATMGTGDMVITYPDTIMYVWVSGRFVSLFSGTGTGSYDGAVWYPTIASDGTLTWSLSYSASQPTPVNIKGEDGHTPVKGVDYFDGVNGVGIPAGGDINELIVKLSTDNYNTTWKSLTGILTDWALAGNVLPDGIVAWSSILNRPEWYQEFGNNSDGFITQDVLTARFAALDSDLAEFTVNLNELKQAKDDFYAHQLDWDNPHHTTPSKIGAVSLGDFTSHTSDFNNPHQVTKTQVGLSNVDNTSDLNKPISTAVQTVIDAIYAAINSLDTNFASANYIKNVSWDNSTLSLVLTFRDDTTLSIPIPIANLQVRFDSSTNELVFTQPDTSEVRVDVSALIPVYQGSDSDNIHVVIENDNAIKATIIPGTVGQYEIAPSVNLRNSPTTTTQVVSDRSTKIATTEFVASQTINNLISYDTDRPLSANMGRILNQEKVDLSTVQQMINDISIADVIDNLDSTNQTASLSANMGRYLNLTKAPRVHTSPNGATFGIATISLFGHTRASEVDPEMDGTVFRGTDDGRYARADHRHPTDITRASVSDLNDHVDSPVASEDGAHELRFYNNSLDYKDENGNWTSVFGYLRRPNTAYLLGDVIQDLNLPKWAELECVYGGTTGNGPLVVPIQTVGSYTGVCIGDYILDGTVKWVIRAKRTQLLLDVPTPFVGNFETITVSQNISYSVPIHKELGIPMLDCRFCDGTNGTVDMRDRFIMGKTSISTADVTGGSDTVTLQSTNLPKVEYTLNMAGLEGKTAQTNLSNLTYSIPSSGAHTNHTTQGIMNWSGETHTENWFDFYREGENSGNADHWPLRRILAFVPNTVVGSSGYETWASSKTEQQMLKWSEVPAASAAMYVGVGGSLDAAILAGGSAWTPGRIPLSGRRLDQTDAEPANGYSIKGITRIALFNTEDEPADIGIKIDGVSKKLIGGDHTHSGSNMSMTLKSVNTTINSGQTVKFKLNESNASSFSVVSKHYKLAYIQRIY